MHSYHVYLFLVLLLLAGCQESTPPATTVAEATPSRPDTQEQRVIDKAIKAHGGSVLDRVVINFDYRDKHFEATRNNGLYEYVRTYTDSTGAVREVYNNNEAFREENGQRVEITDKKEYSIQEINNSVIYFAFVPYFLNDAAVRKKYLGTATVLEKPYHKVEITFVPENGGPDFEDRFIYWIHQENFTVDFLAYDFHINDGGTRFREAYNIRDIAGVRVADYKNYTSDLFPQPGTPIENYDTLLGTEDLKLLSEINLENVTIEPIK